MEQEKKYTVYIQTNKINNKSYVGITSLPVEKRWENGGGYKKQPYFYNAIQKYGWNNFEHIIFMVNLTKEDACHIEKMLIALFDTTNRDKGYNIQYGGETGNLGIPMSEETKKKLSEAKKGHKPTMETRLKLRESQIKWWTEERRMRKREECLKNKNPMFGIPQYGEDNPFYGKRHTDETKSKISAIQKKRLENPEERMKLSERAKILMQDPDKKRKISEAWKGRKHTEETKKKMSESKKGQNNPNYGNKYSEERIDKMINADPNRKEVICLETGIMYRSLREAERLTGISYTQISKCCKHQPYCLTAGGFHWMFYTEYICRDEVIA